MEQFYVFANSKDSLNMFNDNVGGRFRVYFPNPYVLDGTGECALLEATFVPKLTTPMRRIYVCCDFVDNSSVRESYISVLQSLSVLNEDVTDVTFENLIYHRNIHERRQPRDMPFLRQSHVLSRPFPQKVERRGPASPWR